MPQKRLSPSLSAPRAPLPSRNGFTAWWFGACLTWLTPWGSHCALWVWGEVLLARFKAFVGVWRGLVGTHDEAQQGKAVAESAQRNVKLALAKRANEAGLSPDSVSFLAGPRGTWTPGRSLPSEIKYVSVGFLFLLASRFVFPGHGELCGLCLATCQIRGAASRDTTLQGWDIPQQDLFPVEQGGVHVYLER